MTTTGEKKQSVGERIVYLNDQGLLDKRATLEEQNHSWRNREFPTLKLDGIVGRSINTTTTQKNSKANEGFPPVLQPLSSQYTTQKGGNGNGNCNGNSNVFLSVIDQQKKYK